MVALGSDNAQVEAGRKFSLVLKADGRVMAFGRNSVGELGLPPNSGYVPNDISTWVLADYHTPTQVAALGGDNAQLAAGSEHSLVLKGYHLNFKKLPISYRSQLRVSERVVHLEPPVARVRPAPAALLGHPVGLPRKLLYLLPRAAEREIQPKRPDTEIRHTASAQRLSGTIPLRARG